MNFFFLRADSERRLNEHIAELKKQVKGRDDIIQRLERDLKAKEELYIEVEEKLGMKDQAYKSIVDGRHFSSVGNIAQFFVCMTCAPLCTLVVY